MIIRPRRHMLVPLLTLCMTLAVAAAVQAQDRQHQGSGASATLRVSLGTAPQWVDVPGTRVRTIRQGERPDYDMFQYDRNYYAYRDNRWYMSPRESGDFTLIDDRSVPSDFSGIPREHWRNYPSGWQGRQHQGPGGRSASLQVHFGTTPRWMSVRGTRVRMIRQSQRPDYDMFQYGRNYYVYNDNQWYMSRRPRGQFMVMDERFVPRELSRVPRGHWRNYPSEWSDQNRDHRDDRTGRRQ
jgi:hypothetical protein